MNTQTKAQFTKDAANKKIKVVKDFDADIHDVWNAYTDGSLLDQWWAPKPYRAETKEMNFKPGGCWLYAMVGPDGNHQWAKLEFETIDAPNGFTGTDAFTDEKGTRNSNMPSIHWTNSFEQKNNGTRLTAELDFDTVEEMNKILDTEFEQGFRMGLDNLDDLLAK